MFGLPPDLLISPNNDNTETYFVKRLNCKYLKSTFILFQDLVGQVKRIAKFLGHPLSDEQAEKVAHLSTMDEMRKTYDKHEKEDPNGIMNTRRLGMLKFLNKGMHCR